MAIETTIITIDPKKIKLTEINARFMTHETYQRLVANIAQDGKLTSIPFGAIDGFFSNADQPRPRRRRRVRL